MLFDVNLYILSLIKGSALLRISRISVSKNKVKVFVKRSEAFISFKSSDDKISLMLIGMLIYILTDAN